jgi:tetratricopeptide (TPR) repeat protein
MRNRRKTLFYLAGGLFAAIVLGIVLGNYVVRNKYLSKIPVVSESEILTNPVKEQISEAIEIARKKPSSQNLGNLGMVYHASARYNEAAECYLLARERDSNGWKWDYYLGYLNLEMGNSQQAIDNFTSVVDKNPEAFLAWYYIGQEYKNLGKIELAENALNKVIRSARQVHSGNSVRTDNFPLSTYAGFLLSRIYVETDRLELAEKASKEVILNSESFGPAYRMLGTIYNLLGDQELSKEFTVRAGDLVLFSPPVDTLIDKLVLISRSELYLLKRIDEAERSVYSDWAVQIVNNGLKYLPENEYLVSKAVRIFLWKNLDKKATSLIDKHIGLLQKNAKEMFRTGMLFYQKELLEQAKKYWLAASKLDTADIEIQKHLALSMWRLGEKEESHLLLNNLYEKNRNNPEILADINYIMYHSGLKDKAVKQLNQIKQRSPSNAKVLKLSGEIAEENGSISQAIRLYQSSFKEDPEDLKTIQYLGNLLQKQQLFSAYIQLYNNALEHHPNEPEVLANLGTFLINCPDTFLRNIPEGIKYTERAFTHIESTPGILVSAGNHLAIAYYMLGDKKRAVSAVSKAINIARRENIAQSFQTRLENLYTLIQRMDN